MISANLIFLEKLPAMEALECVTYLSFLANVLVPQDSHSLFLRYRHVSSVELTDD
jgi:hypothetical protein